MMVPFQYSQYNGNDNQMTASEITNQQQHHSNHHQ